VGERRRLRSCDRRGPDPWRHLADPDPVRAADHRFYARGQIHCRSQWYFGRSRCAIVHLCCCDVGGQIHLNFRTNCPDSLLLLEMLEARSPPEGIIRGHSYDARSSVLANFRK